MTARSYYCTKKRVNDYITLTSKKFENNEEFKTELNSVIKNLNEHPDENRNQLRFFNKVKLELNSKSK